MSKRHELICRLVSEHELSPNDRILRDEYFTDTHANYWSFLKEYFLLFGRLPDKPTFMDQFPSFDWEDVYVQAQLLAANVREEYIALTVQKCAAEAVDIAKLDVDKAVEHFRKIHDELSRFSLSGVPDSGNLQDQLYELSELKRRRESGQHIGITLGLADLDEVTTGTKVGEIEVYFARTGVGKSFWLLYGAIKAADAGYRVAYVSPEMDRLETGVRFQSFVVHVSSMNVMSGKMDATEWEDYEQKILSLKRDGSPIFFYDPMKIGRRFKPSDIRQIINDKRPQLVCIDGLQLMEPDKDARELRIRISNTIAELKSIAVETGVPIRVVHQANRESEQRPKSTPLLDDILPKLHHLAESGAVEQYANRAIVLAKHEDRMYMCVRKNRGGPEGLALSFHLDADRGRVKSVIKVQLAAELASLETSYEKDPTKRF